MFCRFCGQPNDDNAKFCSSCGSNLEESVSVQGQPNLEAQPVSAAPVKTSGKAIAGFVLSLSGILIAALICGTLGLVFSCMAFKEINERKLRGRGLAIAGLVISIVDIICGFIIILG